MKELFANSTNVRTSPIPPIDYLNVHLSDIKMELNNPGTNQKRRVTSMSIDGQPVEYTERFGTSFCAQLGLSRNIFSLFEFDEVAARAVERRKADVLRIGLVREQAKSGQNVIKVLAATKPGKPLITADNLLFSLGKFGVANDDIKYHNGIISSTHTPTIGGDAPVDIGGDIFHNRFVVDTPIDGYGLPAAYVSLMRMRCSNGAIGYSKAFKSEINLGNDSDTVAQFNRFIDGFSNDEGYDGIRRRFEAAINSPASLYEFNSLYQLIVGDKMRSMHGEIFKGEMANGQETLRSRITDKLWKLGGDPLHEYGLVSLEQVAAKKLHMLTTACSMYDLINFATELSTHHTENSDQGRRLQAWVGSIISHEYDLENVWVKENEGKVSDDTPDRFMDDEEGNE